MLFMCKKSVLINPTFSLYTFYLCVCYYYVSVYTITYTVSLIEISFWINCQEKHFLCSIASWLLKYVKIFNWIILKKQNCSIDTRIVVSQDISRSYNHFMLYILLIQNTIKIESKNTCLAEQHDIHVLNFSMLNNGWR